MIEVSPSSTIIFKLSAFPLRFAAPGSHLQLSVVQVSFVTLERLCKRCEGSTTRIKLLQADRRLVSAFLALPRIIPKFTSPYYRRAQDSHGVHAEIHIAEMPPILRADSPSKYMLRSPRSMTINPIAR